MERSFVYGLSGLLALFACGHVVTAAPAQSRAPSNSGATPSTASQWLKARATLLDLHAWDVATKAERRATADAVDNLFDELRLKELSTFEAGGQIHEVAIFIHGPTGIEFSLVPGGAVTLGSPPDELGRSQNEAQHEALVWPFLIARTEVTQAVWARTMVGSNPAMYKGANRPAELVTWQQASEFCGRNGFALPNEAEWEYAARAGTTTAFPTGAIVSSLQGFANVSDAYLRDHKGEVPYGIDNFSFEGNITDGFATTAPVASFKPNAFGLYDMIGNVMEWCDGICEEAVGHGKPNNPLRPLRGGNWASTLSVLRSATRRGDSSGSGYDGVGFRPIKRLQD